MIKCFNCGRETPERERHIICNRTICEDCSTKVILRISRNARLAYLANRKREIELKQHHHSEAL